MPSCEPYWIYRRCVHSLVRGCAQASLRSRCVAFYPLVYFHALVLQFEPLTKIEKAGMFGTDKYLLHAEISPVALAEVAEEYQQYFAAKAEKVSAQQAQLGGDMQMAESNSRIMYQELNDLKKEAAVASARLSTEGRILRALGPSGLGLSGR